MALLLYLFNKLINNIYKLLKALKLISHHYLALRLSNKISFTNASIH